MTSYIALEPNPGALPQDAHVFVFLINGSGLSVSLLAGFLLLTAYMIARG